MESVRVERGGRRRQSCEGGSKVRPADFTRRVRCSARTCSIVLAFALEALELLELLCELWLELFEKGLLLAMDDRVHEVVSLLCDRALYTSPDADGDLEHLALPFPYPRRPGIVDPFSERRERVLDLDTDDERVRDLERLALERRRKIRREVERVDDWYTEETDSVSSGQG